MRRTGDPGARDAPLKLAWARCAGLAVEAPAIGSATLLVSADCPGNPSLNRAYDVDAREPGVAERIVALARAAGLRPLLEIAEPSLGEAERRELATLGLAHLWDVIALRLDLGEPLPFAPSSDAVVRPALPTEAAAFGALAVRAFGAPPAGVPADPNAERIWSALCRLGLARCFFAERGGVPCAIGVFMRVGPVAFVDGAATLPEHRGHGCQGALLSRRLHEARAAGALAAVTRAGAGSASVRNLERAGMRTSRRMQVWGEPR
jgi:hypothetical protein